MDYAQAVVLYRQAGERSNAAAQSNLGLMYEHGQGVPQDYVSAHMWLSLEATSQTDPRSSPSVAILSGRAKLIPLWMTILATITSPSTTS